MQSLDEPSRIALDTALRCADDVERGFQQAAFNPDGDPAKAAYVFFLSKMLRTFRAFGHLVRQGFLQEAEVLTRCNFEALVDWRYIGQEPRGRGNRWMLYLDACRSKQLHVLEQLEESGEPHVEIPDRILKEVKDAEAEFCRLYGIAKFAKTKNWAGCDIRARADRVGLLKYYLLAYKQQSDIVHCGPNSITPSLDFSDRDVLGMRAGPCWDGVRRALSLGCALLGLCMQEASNSFSLDCDSVLADLAKSIQEYGDAT